MKISRQSRRDAKSLFAACQVGGLLDEGRVRKTVQSLIEQKPRGYLAILSHFQRLVKLDIDRRTATVESAIPLSSDQQNAIGASLTRRYGPGLNTTFAQNSALMGGLRIKVGSDVYDSSIQARLNALAETF
jgi:F-type H+-transporting ATPase subunit delta